MLNFVQAPRLSLNCLILSAVKAHTSPLEQSRDLRPSKRPSFLPYLQSLHGLQGLRKVWQSGSLLITCGLFAFSTLVHAQSAETVQATTAAHPTTAAQATPTAQTTLTEQASPVSQSAPASQLSNTAQSSATSAQVAFQGSPQETSKEASQTNVQIATETAKTAHKLGGDLYFFNWSDYIDPQVLKDFEAETGIKVHYSLMDSNEMLEAKMIAGHSGYDVIAPSLHILKRLADLELLMPLDKSKLPNLKHLDPQKMAKIATVDPGNTYGIPYMELSTAIAYNERKVQEILGKDFKVDSWDVLFKPEIVSKLSACGVTALDSASDMLCTALIYMGRSPESINPQDYADAGNLIANIGKYLTYFHSSQYVNDLASGEICMSVAWAGDAQIANQRSQEAGLDKIVYVIPKEGALMGYDMLAIPHDAPNPENAHAFLNYLMRPDVIAKISNYIRYANANKDATALVDKELTSNPGIYYDQSVLPRLHIVVPPIEMERIMTKEWNKVVVTAGQK